MSLNLLTNPSLNLVGLSLNMIAELLGTSLLPHLILSLAVRLLLNSSINVLIVLLLLSCSILTIDVQVVYVRIDLQVDRSLVDLLLLRLLSLLSGWVSFGLFMA